MWCEHEHDVCVVSQAPCAAASVRHDQRGSFGLWLRWREVRGWASRIDDAKHEEVESYSRRKEIGTFNQVLTRVVLTRIKGLHEGPCRGELAMQVVTLKQLAKEAKVSPKTARRRLRGSDLRKDNGRWEWSRRDRRRVLRQISD